MLGSPRDRLPSPRRKKDRFSARGGSFQKPDMMVLERCLTPSSGRLGAQGGGEGAGTADSSPETE